MLSIGIVGLPNVGKSTLFNALVKSATAEASNYPFCTIDPNVGVVEVPDERLKVLAEISHSEKVIPAVVEFIDIAGLVRGASKGEGLGNKFLANIRECDAIAIVVRFFEDPKITHVSGKIEPEEDIITIETELQLADLSTVEKRLESAQKEAKTDKNALDLISGLEKIKKLLEEGKNAREATLTEKESQQIRLLQLLTMKPVLYVANVGEKQMIGESENQRIGNFKSDFIQISAKIEAELSELSPEEQREYLQEIGSNTSGLNKLIAKAYETLGLISYLTSGEKETRAWTIKKGSTAPQAAGVIHSDFERGFIAADVCKYDDFVGKGLPSEASSKLGWQGCRNKGLVKTEGKNYIVQDGDVVLFKFNV